MARIVEEEGGVGYKKAMFGMILSPGPDVVLALLSFPLQRKHTLILTI